MKPVDLTHPFTIHTPGWVDYPTPKLSYFQRLATHGIVSQWLETPLHASTHLDAEMHIISGGNDIESIPIDRLCREGVIVDISDDVEDFTVIKKEMITDKMEVKKGDILLYHTGYHRYYSGMPDEDDERYFLRHPGPDREFAEWVAEMQFAWNGFDCASGDHPMNTSIRHKRPDARKQYEEKIGADVNTVFPEDDVFVMHKVPFAAGVTHLENLGGDIDKVLNRRCLIGAFPLPIVGGEGSPCRVVAFLDE